MPAMDNAYGLVVGIADYANVRPLPATVINDAEQLHAALTDPELGAYDPKHVALLRNGEATREALLAALDTLQEQADADATVCVYFSGHGGQIDAGPHAGEYLVPVDARVGDDDTLASTCIAGEEFSARLRAIPARRVVVIFDCCHAGGIGEVKGLEAAAFKGLSDGYLDTLKSGRGRVIFSSSRSDELSWVLPGAANSLFTAHLLGGLRGGANGAGGVIRIFDLFDYLQPRVTADKTVQHPIFKAEIEENFPIALFRGGQKAAAAPAAGQAANDRYAYDAYVSYSETPADRPWVRKFVGELEAQGFRVAVDYRAPLGMPRITFAEQAVAQSRYTLVLLSPAYNASGFSEFQSLIAQTIGQEEGAYRVLPLLIAPCTPRLGLRILPLLDMTEPGEYAWNVARLVEYLRTPPAQRPV